MEKRPTDQIQFRKDLYPRFKHNPALVQQYAQDLDKLPPIQINQNDELIDGFHRWTAYKTNEIEQIPVEVIPTATELELLLLAVRANSQHGWQLTAEDKRRLAVQLYELGKGQTKEEIAQALSVSVQTVRAYLSGIDRRIREERKQQIFDLYMDCHTQNEIAEGVVIARKSVDDIIKSFGENESTFDFAKSILHEPDSDYKTPIYNIWTFGKLSNEVKHPGNSEQGIVDNLLDLYTEPFDIVFDPFAGGGSTIDVCRKRLRRCYASDRKPIPAREHQIRELDIVKSMPDLNKRWSDVSLTYLDPPYWKQAENQYSTDPEDLANMSLDDFTESLISIVKKIGHKQTKGVIALLIQPTQWLAEGKEVVDHVIDLASSVNLRLMSRVICPYSTEQYNSKQVDWAKENKELLVLNRELIIWKV